MARKRRKRYGLGHRSRAHPHAKKAKAPKGHKRPMGSGSPGGHSSGGGGGSSTGSSSVTSISHEGYDDHSTPGTSSVTAVSHEGYGGGGGGHSTPGTTTPNAAHGAEDVAAVQRETHLPHAQASTLAREMRRFGIPDPGAQLARAAGHPARMGDLHRRAERQAREARHIENAHAFKEAKVAETVKKHVETDKNGKPKTHEVQVQAPKEEVKRALDHYQERLKHISSTADSVHDARQKVEAARQQAKAAMFHTVEVPKFKSPDDQKAFVQKMHHIGKTAEALRTGEVKVEDLSPRSRHQVRKQRQSKRQLKAMTPDERALAKAGIEPMSALGSVAKAFGEVSAETGLSKVFDYLTRPGAFVETGVGKFLAGEDLGPIPGPHLIKGDTAKKIHKAPSPGEAFSEGFGNPKVVSGGDITQGLFKARSAGLLADIALDPTTYIGAGALLKSVPKLGEVAKLEALVAKKAPDVFQDERYLRYASMGRRSGDYTELRNYLQSVKEARGLKGIVSRKSVKARLAAHRAQTDALAAAARRRLANAEKIGNKPVALFGKDAQEAIAQAYRSSELHRGIKPGFRVSLGNPLRPIDRPLVTAKVPLPGSLRLPALSQLSRHEAGGYVQTLAQFTERLSRTRTMREVTRLSNDMARNLDQHQGELLSEALRPLTHKGGVPRATQIADLKGTQKDAFNRVGLYMLLRNSYQSEAAAKAALNPTARELKTVDNLDKLFRAQAAEGRELGILHASIPFYSYQMWQHGTRDFAGTIDPRDPFSNRPPQGSSHGSTMSAAKHRENEAFTSLASEDLLTDAIQKLSRRDLTREQAAREAQKAYEQAKGPAMTELLARHVLRGGQVNMNELSAPWQRTVMNATRADENRIFANPLDTDGVLKLSENAERYHDFAPIELPYGQAEAASLHAVEADLERTRAMQNHYDPESDTYKALDEHADRLAEEAGKLRETHIADLDEKVAQAEHRASRLTDIVDELEHQRERYFGEWTDSQKATNEAELDQAHTLYSRQQEALDHLYELRNSDPDALIPPHEVQSAHEDPLDYSGRLRDVRMDHPDMFPILDPTVTTFYRSRMEAVKVAYASRWRGIDQARGIDRDTAAEHGLTPNRDKSIWYDSQGVAWREPYRQAIERGDDLGKSIQNVIGPGRLWPSHTVDDAVAEAMRLGEDDFKRMFYTGAEKAIGKTFSLLRYGFTTPYPPFHIRNMVSDVLKSVQAGGTGLVFHPIVTGQLVALAFRRGKKGLIRIPGMKEPVRMGVDRIKLPGFEQPLKYEEFLYMTDLFGIRSGQHLAEYLRLAQTGRRRTGTDKLKSAGGLGLGPQGPIGKRMIELGARREDVMRFLTFTQRMRTNGGDVAEATWYMTKHHFDYSDLTASEKQTVRNLFLFYTWYRKNIPLQFAELISRPGFFAGVANTYYDMPRGETPLNQDWSKIAPWLPDMSGQMPMKGIIPDYMLNPINALQTNWNGHAAAFGFAAPWVDMNLVTNLLASDRAIQDLQQIGSMMNPAFGLMLSAAYQTDPLTGRRYKKYEPVPNWIATALGAMGIPVKDNPETGSKNIPFRIASLIRNFPVLGRGASYGLPPSGTNDTGYLATHRWTAQFLGLTPYISPSKSRKEAEWYDLLQSKIGESTQLSFDISNLTEPEKKAEKAKFEKDLLQWAKDHHIPRQFIADNVNGLSFSVDQRKQGGGSSDTGFGSASSGAGFGGTSSAGSGSSYGFGNQAPKSGSPKTSTTRHEAKTTKVKSTYLMPKAGQTSAAATLNAPAPQKPDTTLAKAQPHQPTQHARATLAHVTQGDGPYASEFAKAAVKYGKQTGVNPSVLYSIAGIETDHGQNVSTSSAGAQGPMQFMPETARQMIAQHGVDPNASVPDAVHAAALYLKDSGYQNSPRDAIFAYNHADWYVNEVLKGAQAAAPLDRLAGGDVGQVGGGSSAPLMTVKKPGKYQVADGANRDGVPLTEPLLNFVASASRKLPGKAKPVITTGSNHSQMTASGYVSDHWTGNGADFGLAVNSGGDMAWGDDFATAALQAAGYDRAKARELATGGGIHDVNVDGYRVQIIWRAPDHYDHVHIGVKAEPGTQPTDTSQFPDLSGVGSQSGTVTPPTSAPTQLASAIAANTGMSPQQAAQVPLEKAIAKLRPSSFFKSAGKEAGLNRHGQVYGLARTRTIRPGSSTYFPDPAQYDIPAEDDVAALEDDLRRLKQI